MARKDPSQQTWQAPDFFTAKPNIVAGWCNEIVQDREAALKTTQQYKDVGLGFDLIAGKPDNTIQEQRSPLNSNRAKRSMREIVAALSDTRQVDGYETGNSAVKDEVQMLNGVMKGLYYERFFDRAMKRCVQWFTVTGEASIWPTYRKVRMGPGADSAMCFDVFGLLDVLPFMQGFDGETQNAYANIIFKLFPMPQAHSMFPLFQHKLKGISKKRYDTVVGNKRLTLAEMFMGKPNGAKMSDLCTYSELRYMPIRDMSVNTTGIPIPMGTGSNSYVVPSLDQEIPSTEIQDGGKRKMRKAEVEDCYFFPHMRLIITADGCDVPLYDGPHFDWSGMMPARYSADSWPWEKISYSLIRDIYEIERSRQHLERSLDQMVRHRGDPSIGYDVNKIPTKEAEAFDPWRERGRLGFQGDADEKSWRTLIPENMLNAPSWMFELLKHYEEEGDYMLGLNAISSMAKAKMGVSGDAMEKLLELAGPLVKDISRSMEPPTRDVMEICKYIIFQNYDTRRIMNYVGPDGVTPVTFDFDPEKLFPSHMPGEDTGNLSEFTSRERARYFASNLHQSVTPNSLHAVTQTAQKLLNLQLWRGGFPIAPDTVAKSLDIANWGHLDGTSEFERWQSFKKKEVEFASQIKELAGSLAPAGQPQSGGTAAGSQKGKGGRPPSGNKPPAAKTKGSAEGQRSTVTES
jgi:hypothetical protein